MTTPALRRLHRYTYEGYLETERDSNVKHEFLEGEIYAMAGGSRQHAALAMNVGAAFLGQLRDRPCVVHSSDLKVRVVATSLTTYPDVTVVCGPAEDDPANRHVLLNPTVVVEVTSPSSEEWDGGEKLGHYKQISSLAACVIVSHREKRLDLFHRETDGGWRHQVAVSGGTLDVPALGCVISVDDVYRNIDLTAPK